MNSIQMGGCQCGTVRYAVSGQPKTVVVCHCSECQRISGSAFGMTMVLAKEHFAITKGTLKVFSRTADSGRLMHGHFCPECGTRIFHEKDETAGVVLLRAGTLDVTSDLLPSIQLWTKSKQVWCELPANIRSFESQPE